MSLARLASAHALHDPARTVLLVAATAAVVLVPSLAGRLVDAFERTLTRRARSTPLIVGAPGSRFDLVLAGLHFRGRVPARVTMASADRLAATGLCTPVPLHVQHSVRRDWPVVGTVPEYHEFRGLRPDAGTLPLMLGDCAVGAEAARALGVGVGDRLVTDPENVYDLSAGYPLDMAVVGVLAPTRSPDDRAVFVSLDTAWVLDGIAHGHAAPDTADPADVARRDGRQVEFNASLYEAQRITPQTLPSFHVHAERSELPLTAVLALPHDDRSRTFLRARARDDDTLTMLRPEEVVDELLRFVLRIKRLFDANALVVGGAALGFFGLIVLLDVRGRRSEFAMLGRIGAPPRLPGRMVAFEFTALAMAGVACGGLAAWVLGAVLPLDDLLLRVAGAAS